MMECKVVRTETVANGIKSFDLSPIDQTVLPAFKAGAHIDLLFGENNQFKRQYSLIKTDHLNNIYRIAVLNDPQTRGGSKWLHDNLSIGHTVQISQPKNLFELDAQSEHCILFAGGIGITPILSMAMELYLQGRSFELHYSSRSKAVTAFFALLNDHPISAWTHLHFDDQPETALNIAEILNSPKPNQSLYVCGPTGFIHFVEQSALNLGWQPAHIHKEMFSNSALTHAQETTQAFELVLAKSNRILTVSADQSALEVLLEHQFDVDCSCEQGICGTCVLEVLDGEILHRDQYLTDQEKSSNTCFTPCCSRAKGQKLVINL